MPKTFTALIPGHCLAVSLALGLVGGPALADGSGQHSAQSVYHSGKAASHGSAALATGAATVSAVPIILFGGAITVSGAALAEVGTGSLAAGSALARAGAGQPAERPVTPDAPPRLD